MFANGLSFTFSGNFPSILRDFSNVGLWLSAPMGVLGQCLKMRTIKMHSSQKCMLVQRLMRDNVVSGGVKVAEIKKFSLTVMCTVHFTRSHALSTFYAYTRKSL